MKKLLFTVFFVTSVALVSCNNSSQNTSKEESSAFPIITEQGVDPFVLGSSMYDIPAKGDFYDTILLEKKYNAYMDGLTCGNNMSEEEMQELKKEYNWTTLEIEAFGFAFVIKDNDTLIKIDYDENAKIQSIEVFSEQIKMQNGVHVGLSATEMLENHNALFITPSSYNSELGENGLGDDATFELPNQSVSISIKAIYDKINFEYKEQYERKMMETMGFCAYDTLPLEAVKGSSVRSIVINK